MNLNQALASLSTYNGTGDSAVEDGLFAYHAVATMAALQGQAALTTPIQLWESQLRPAVEAAEQRLGKSIHKGAPLYNNGICSFLLNDFEGAFQYVLDAETENRRLGPGAFDLLIGKDQLSRPWVVDTLIRDTGPKWSTDYQAITGCPLDAAELIALFEWLAQRPSDAFVVVAALHRARRAVLRRVPNDATRQMVVRALADMVVSMESTLRRVQQSSSVPVTGQLKARLDAMLKQENRVKTAFGVLKSYGPGESASDLNAIVTEAENRFRTATAESGRAGYAAYVAYRFRNSVLHVNEESLTIYQDLDLGVRMIGWVLATCRIIRHFAENTHTSLS